MTIVWGTLRFQLVDFLDVLVGVAAFLTAERSLHAVLQQLADAGVVEAPWFDITDDLPQYAEYAPPG